MCKHWKGSSPSFTATLTHTFPSFTSLATWRGGERLPLPLWRYITLPGHQISQCHCGDTLLTSWLLYLLNQIFPWYKSWLPAVIFSLIGKREKVSHRKDRCRWKWELESDKHLGLFVESLIKVEWLSNWFVTVTLTWPSIMAMQAWVELLRWGDCCRVSELLWSEGTRLCWTNIYAVSGYLEHPNERTQE